MGKRFGKVPVKKPSKNIVMFVVSLAVGGVGVFYSKQYIEGEIAGYKASLEKTEVMTEVVVPRRALMRGDILTANDLQVHAVPKQYVDPSAVLEATYETAIGQRVEFDVQPGLPLLWAHLEGGMSPTFSGKVPTGLRAMTIRVDEINSISGFLQPKDRIDLLLTYGNKEDKKIFPLLQNLNVIATGVQTYVDKSGSNQRPFTTITIQVSPEQAQKITLSQQVGKITAMLRNPDDESPLSKRPMTTAQLLNLPVAKPKPKKKVKKYVKPKPRIEYIIGGS